MSFWTKFRRIFIAAAAVISLCASSVAACTCSHQHEQAKVEQTSCHSHSHDQEASAESKMRSSKTIDSSCECTIVKPVPAIVARSDKDRDSARPDTEPQQIENPTFEGVAYTSTRSIKIERRDLVIDPSSLTGLLPPRAPPRL